MLNFTVHPDHEAVSQAAAAQIADELRSKPTALICLATGSTPTRTYELLAAQAAKEPALLSKARILNLDEWGGLPEGDPATCGHHLHRTLIDPLRLDAQYTSFASSPVDADAECARIAAWLRNNGPIDLCVLGLGVNGHLGFNEPADELQPHAHVADLSAASLGHAMVGSRPQRPTYGLTLGMADLLQSGRIWLLVTGATKREPLARLREGRVTTMMPASLLHLHANATVLYDEAALPRS